MNNQSDPQPTVAANPVDKGSETKSPTASAPDSQAQAPPAASVLQTLGPLLPEKPQVHLRDPDGSVPAALNGTAPGQAIGRYQMLGEIARGGMGAILKGRDHDLGRDIAVKVLLENHQGKTGLLMRFVEEAQIGGQLQHPGIVPVYELGTFPDQRPYFTMKLVKGQTLAKLLAEREEPVQDRPRFLKIFEQVCQTLAYAHSRGVIHRDLKPANVMVGAFGEVQVMDWGLAKVLRARPSAEPEQPQPPTVVSIIRTRRGEDSDEAPEGTQTQAGSVLGTPAYMPPEQALGEVERLDERADVFGLGAILCEILTGKPPYVGVDAAQIHRKAVRADLADALARLDGCGADPELVHLTRRCLAAEAEDRPGNAGVLASELTTYLESVEGRLRQAELAEAEARARATEERKRRKLAVALVGAVFGLVLLGGGGWFYVAHKEAERGRETLARQTEAARQVQEALGRADSLRQQARTDDNPAQWAEARALVDRARSLLTDLPAGHELEGQVHTLASALAEEEKDRRLLLRLEEIWLLRAEIDAQAAGFALRRSLREYPPLFAEHGLRVGDDEATSSQWVLRRPPQMRTRLIAGLDAWLGLARQLKAPEAGWLFGVLQAVDEDTWRKDLRAALARDDIKEVERLARPEALGRQPAQTVLLLADYFRPRSQSRAETLLRAAQNRFPADFWVNFALADFLYQKHFTALSDVSQFEDAVRFFTTALALRPDNLHVQTLLGWSLWLRGRRQEGREVLQQIIARRPDYLGAYVYLGYLYLMEGADRQGEEAFLQALKLQPRSGMAHSGIGFVLWGRGQYPEALVAFRRGNRLEPFPRGILGQIGILGHASRMDEALSQCRQALQLQPDFAEVQVYSQLLSLVEARRPDEAVAFGRGLILLRPNNPEAHIALQNAQLAQNRLDDALTSAKRALALAQKGPLFPLNLLTLFVRETEQGLLLRPHLAAYAKGERTPRDVHELILLVDLFWVQQQYHGAAQMYSHALAAHPEWTSDVTHEHRFQAARDAACAAVGLGDGAKLDEQERIRWRKQALDWLQADLAGWQKLLKHGSDDDRALAQERLRWWQEDPKLTSLRDPAAVAKLSAAEQQVCQQLWAEVSALLAPKRQGG